MHSVGLGSYHSLSSILTLLISSSMFQTKLPPSFPMKCKCLWLYKEQQPHTHQAAWVLRCLTHTREARQHTEVTAIVISYVHLHTLGTWPCCRFLLMFQSIHILQKLFHLATRHEQSLTITSFRFNFWPPICETTRGIHSRKDSTEHKQETFTHRKLSN